MRALSCFSVLGLSLALALGIASSATAAEEAAKPTGTVSGKVVDSEGKAVKGATVIAVAGERPARGEGGADRPNRERPAPLAKATTGDDGAYKLENVPAGKVRIIATLEATGRGNVGPVEVTAGKDTAADEIKLAKRTREGGGEAGREGARRRGGDAPKADAPKTDAK